MPDHIEKVVVVVNPQMSTIKRIINQTDINTIQLHGNESIQLIRNIKKLNSKIRIIKAIPATRNLNNNIQKYKDRDRHVYYRYTINHIRRDRSKF